MVHLASRGNFYSATVGKIRWSRLEKEKGCFGNSVAKFLCVFTTRCCPHCQFCLPHSRYQWQRHYLKLRPMATILRPVVKKFRADMIAKKKRMGYGSESLQVKWSVMNTAHARPGAMIRSCYPATALFNSLPRIWEGSIIYWQQWIDTIMHGFIFREWW